MSRCLDAGPLVQQKGHDVEVTVVRSHHECSASVLETDSGNERNSGIQVVKSIVAEEQQTKHAICESDSVLASVTEPYSRTHGLVTQMTMSWSL